MYEVDLNQDDEEEEEEQMVEEVKKDSTSDSESTADSTSGENGHEEESQQRVSSSDSVEYVSICDQSVGRGEVLGGICQIHTCRVLLALPVRRMGWKRRASGECPHQP